MIGQTIPHHRKSIRLREYDYSLPGSYFVTVCTKDRVNFFDGLTNGIMEGNKYGGIVRTCWEELPNHYENIMLVEFVVMPNHVHGIIIIIDNIVGAIHELPLPRTRKERRGMFLPKIIGRFKMNSSKRINAIRGTLHEPVWQRNYYEHIIRNERSLNNIREYIKTNPEQWTWDKENALFQGTDEFDRRLNEEGKQKIKDREIL